MRGFDHIETWVFDLDNTLYPASCRLFDQIDRKMTGLVSEILKIAPTEARTIQKGLFHKYGTTLRGVWDIPAAALDALECRRAKVRERWAIIGHGWSAHAEGGGLVVGVVGGSGGAGGQGIAGDDVASHLADATPDQFATVDRLAIRLAIGGPRKHVGQHHAHRTRSIGTQRYASQVQTMIGDCQSIPSGRHEQIFGGHFEVFKQDALVVGVLERIETILLEV